VIDLHNRKSLGRNGAVVNSADLTEAMTVDLVGEMWTSRLFRSGAIVLAVSGLAIIGKPAPAQVAAICGDDRSLTAAELELALIGRYSVELGPGYAVAGGMVIPHPAQPSPEFGRIDRIGDQLSLVPQGGAGVTLDLDWVEEGTWRFDRAPSLPEGVQAAPGQSLPILPFDSETLGLRAGCPINELPRLVGTGAVSVDGVVMHFTYRLMVVGRNQLAGFQEVSATVRGQPMFERRPVRMLTMADPAEND